MGLPKEFRDVAAVINSYSQLPQRSPDWWGKMLSSIVLAVGMDANIRLVSARAADSGEYKIVVITDDLLVVAVATDVTHDDSDFSVELFSLNRFSSIRVRASDSVFGDGFPSHWPGRVSVELSHADAGVVQLPVGDGNNYEWDKLLELLPELLSQLRSRS